MRGSRPYEVFDELQTICIDLEDVQDILQYQIYSKGRAVMLLERAKRLCEQLNDHVKKITELLDVEGTRRKKWQEKMRAIHDHLRALTAALTKKVPR